MKRLLYLDNLKVCLTVLVIFHHAGQAYGDGGEWNDFVTEWFGIYESLLCVFISFGLLWLFREYGGWSSKFWQWCAAQAYGAYIVHLLHQMLFLDRWIKKLI